MNWYVLPTFNYTVGVNIKFSCAAPFEIYWGLRKPWCHGLTLLEHTNELQGYFKAETSIECVLFSILHKSMVNKFMSKGKMHGQFFHIFTFPSTAQRLQIYRRNTSMNLKYRLLWFLLIFLASHHGRSRSVPLVRNALDVWLKAVSFSTEVAIFDLIY